MNTKRMQALRILCEGMGKIRQQKIEAADFFGQPSLASEDEYVRAVSDHCKRILDFIAVQAGETEARLVAGK